MGVSSGFLALFPDEMGVLPTLSVKLAFFRMWRVFWVFRPEFWRFLRLEGVRWGSLRGGVGILGEDVYICGRFDAG